MRKLEIGWFDEDEPWERIHRCCLVIHLAGHSREADGDDDVVVTMGGAVLVGDISIERLDLNFHAFLYGNYRRSPYNFTTGDQTIDWSATEMSGCIVQLPIKLRYRANAPWYRSPQRSFWCCLTHYSCSRSWATQPHNSTKNWWPVNRSYLQIGNSPGGSCSLYFR